MDDVLLKITLSLVGVLYAIFWWGWDRSVKRRDELEARVMFLEKNSVTREELQQTIRDAAADRKAMHEDNKEMLRDVREKLDTMETRRSRTEHAILDSVNQIALKVAASEALSRRSQEGRG